MTSERGQTIFLSILIIFAALARGAHDMWAAMVVYVGTAGLALFHLIKSARSEDKPLRIPLLFPVLGLLLVLIVSFLTSANPSESRIVFTDWVCVILLFYISAQTFRTSQAIPLFFQCLVPALWIQAAAVVFQKFGDFYQPQTKALVRSSEVLSYLFSMPDIFNMEKMGTLVNPNILAAFVLPQIFFLLWMIIRDLKGGKRHGGAWEMSGLAAALVCLILAQSAAAWLCLILGLSTMAWQFRTLPTLQKWKKILRIIFIFVAALMIGVVVYKFIGKIDHVTDPYRDNSNRFYWWWSGILMFLDYPWTGVGLGGFPSAYLSYKVGGTENTLYAHSFPLTVLAETGLMGLLAMLAIVGVGIKTILKEGDAYFSEQPLAPALAALGIFYCFNIGLEYLVNDMMLMVMGGMAMAHIEKPAFRPRLAVILLAVGFVIAAVPFIGSPFLAGRFVVDGQRYATEKNWPMAAQSFTSAVQLDPQSWEAYAGLARVAFENKDPQRAVEFQKRAINKNRLFAPLRGKLTEYQRFL